MTKDTSSNKAKLEQIALRLSDTNLAAKEEAVSKIIDDIKLNGDKAIAEYTKKFDDFEHKLEGDNPFAIKIDTKDKPYFKKLDARLQESLYTALKRIEKFHREEFNRNNFASGWSFKGELGEELGIKYNAIDSVAIYIPGGIAPLLSTVLMTAIPARIAGVRRIVVISPPPINDGILAACEIAKVSEVYAIGGAQAIAALAYGTESITAVDKIVGPGNIYVSLAKKQVYGKVGIDGIYGPSELAIIADDSAKPPQLAADLLSQLEHGSGLESTLLVSPSQQIIDQTAGELDSQINSLAQHKTQEEIDTIRNSLNKWSALLKVDTLDEAIEVINSYAPEHLEIQVESKSQDKVVSQIRNAGAIFIGANSCESLGDYLAGPSHCLPTGGSSRFSSGLQCADFITKSSIIDFSKVDSTSQEFKNLIQDVANIARAEILEGHARAMESRH